MKITIYILRFLLALLFIYSGIDKLFLPFNSDMFKVNAIGSDPLFFEFYSLLQGTGFLYFVGFFQLLCGVLLVFKRTYVLASIMLIPLILCLLMTQMLIAKHMGYIIFDVIVLTLNMILLIHNYPKYKGIVAKTEKGWI